MSAARGDRKPCIHLGCLGTMQFGREAPSDGRDPATVGPRRVQPMGTRGWRCSETPAHFQPDGDQ